MKRTIVFATLLLCAVFAALLCTSCKNVTDAIGLNKTYTVTVASNIENGIITSNKATFKSDETVSLIISPENGYELLLIIASAGSTRVPVRVTGNTATFKMPANNVNINARFQKKNYSVTVSSSISNGNVTADKTTAKMGETVTLTASPASGYQFDSWNVTTAEGENLTVTSGTFTMPASNVTVSATFVAINSAITITNGRATVNRTTVVSADAGTIVTISADSPQTGKEFDHWTTTNYYIEFVNSHSIQTTFIMPSSSVSITAIYKDIMYSLFVNHGTANKTKAKYGDIISLTPDTAPIGQEFDRWSLNYYDFDFPYENPANMTFSMPPRDVTVTALYKDINYTITKNQTSHGSIEVASNATYGSTVTITATPDITYELGSVIVNGNGVSVNVSKNGNSATFTMPASNVTIEATFTPTHLGTKDKPNAVGDIIFNDGTALPASVYQNRELTATEKQNAIAVAAYVQENDYVIAVGLKQEYLAICSENSQGHTNTQVFSHEGDAGATRDDICCGNGGITDYSDSNYPAIYWAQNYTGFGNLATITNDWFIPTKTELSAVYGGKASVLAAIDKIGSQYANPFINSSRSYYLTVSQNEYDPTYVYEVDLNSGYTGNSGRKKDKAPILVIRYFSCN